MAVKELIKSSSYILHPQDSKLVDKIELKLDNNNVSCLVTYHPIVGDIPSNLIKDILCRTLTSEEKNHLQQHLHRLQIKSKE